MSSRAPTYSSMYERMSGNCTRLIATVMVSAPSPPITQASYILDNACGPGIVSEQIKIQHPNARILATDISPSMVEEVTQRISTEKWTNMETDTLDARNLSSLKDNTFTHIFTNLGLPIPGDTNYTHRVTSEIFRVLKPGGVASVSTWAGKFLEHDETTCADKDPDRVWLTAFYNAGLAIRPNEKPQTLMALEPEVLRGSWLAAQLEEGGFGNNVEVKPCVTYTMASSLEELVDNMMLAQQMFFAGYSEEELARVKIVFKEELQNLRTFEVFDGGVRIGMKAWIGRGWKKGDESEIAV
ncbi:S-adenosyl-L-methionine-dependent methyltransferase [Rhexocercosporidium sp. MPI-PUGE-AT-0058]|nr:S-adenosyl-L-methionine-dependent methyltransferase [Rhexocercosporidium sp. MPI-PUGE-AT-0058]